MRGDFVSHLHPALLPPDVVPAKKTAVVYRPRAGGGRRAASALESQSPYRVVLGAEGSSRVLGVDEVIAAGLVVGPGRIDKIIVLLKNQAGLSRRAQSRRERRGRFRLAAAGFSCNGDRVFSVVLLDELRNDFSDFGCRFDVVLFHDNGIASH